MNITAWTAFSATWRLFCGELKAPTIGEPFSRDGILWSLWVDTGNPESLATGGEFAPEV
jgi:hypothetical protein